MTEFFIKPSSGVTVRDPETLEPLAESGELKPKNSYWLRRLNDGDIEVVEQAKKKK
ncbi:DUF2635 domain-containing protein [Gilliamella sp. HK2]|uniref:DUF2635 domain-containing protein n=1 Tax=unclassified Gilliamella TaxID=2685620 RepID=UPI00080DDED2|nr:DUF2635 domain-containing protein [Gilliamella apicola]OCG27188.1 DUF2635 domain-containing protein [Gilliamella apicola]OCG29258.1 DUF2635 domain-containing protein [Gilliamella apicola]